MSSTTTSHVLPLPLPVMILRGAQLGLAVVVLGLSAYGLSWLVFDAVALMLFTAIATLIISVYNIVSFIALKQAYNYWAVLGLDIFGLVFWITSMGLMASWVSSFRDVYSYTCYYYCYRKRDVNLAPRTVYASDGYLAAMKSAAGIAGLETLLFIVSLVLTSIYLHKHRAAGGHCTPGHTGTAAPLAGPGPVPAGAPVPAPYGTEHKQDIEMGQQPQYQPPQQQQAAPVYYEQPNQYQPGPPPPAALPVVNAAQGLAQYPSPSPTPVSQYSPPQNLQQPHPIHEAPNGQSHT